jgi:hypothetical protein
MKRLVFILMLLVASSFALNIDIPDEGFATKNVTIGPVKLTVQLNSTPYIYPNQTTAHYFLIEVNNTKASAISVGKVLKQNITVNGVTLRDANMFIVTGFVHDATLNTTHITAAQTNATSSIAAASVTRYVLEVDTNAWEKGTFNFTIDAGGQTVLIDPNFSTCGTTTTGTGTYTLTQSISCTGHGITVAHSSVIIDLGGFTMVGDGGTSDYGVNINTALTGVTVKNGNINTFGRAVSSVDSNTITVQNVSTTGSTSMAAFYVAATAASITGVSITNNTIVNTNGAQGMRIQSTASSYTITTVNISNNVVSSVSGTNEAMLLSAVGGTISGIIIDSNAITTYGTAGIHFSTASATKDITGSITNNNITDSGGSNVGINIDTVFDPGAGGLIISGNRIWNTTGNGIALNGAKYVTVYNNTIYSVANGVEIDSTTAACNDNNISYNNIYNNISDSYGIHWTLSTNSGANNVVIYNNISNYGKGIGATSAGSTGGTTVSYNNIINGTYCLYFNSDTWDSNTHERNNCTNQTSYAIYINNGDNNKFWNTTITNPGDYAIIVAGTTTWLSAAGFNNTTIYSTVGKFISNNGGNDLPINGITVGYNASTMLNWGTALNFANAHVLDTTTSHFGSDWVSVDTATLTELNAPTTLTWLCGVNGGIYRTFYKNAFSGTRADVLTGTKTLRTCSAGTIIISSPPLSAYANDEIVYNDTVSVPSSSSETVTNAWSSTITPGAGYTNYAVTLTYNGTTLSSQTGAVSGNIVTSTNFVAPLVNTNTNKTLAFSVNLWGGGNNDTYVENYTHTDNVYYTTTSWPFNETGTAYFEQGHNLTITYPTKPTGATNNVTYVSHTYSLADGYCNESWAQNASTEYVTDDSCPEALTEYDSTHLGINTTHMQKKNSTHIVVAKEYYPNRAYSISYNETPESTSAKVVNYNSTAYTEQYLWLLNTSDGNNLVGPLTSAIYNMTFVDETTLTPISADAAAQTYNILLPDGTTKTFGLSYAGPNAEVWYYPNAIPETISSSFETYSKGTYSTRSRFTINQTPNMSSTSAVTIYLAPLNSSSYSLLSVVNNGAPVTGAYIQVLRYYVGTGLYDNIDQKITNNNGQAGGYYDVSAWYKFVIYDSSWNQLYISASPEQFVCTPNCALTINIASQNHVNMIGPYVSAYCAGNNTTNAIVYTFADFTGQATSMNFLAWRVNASNPVTVCNSTVAGSSGGYTCNLAPPENLSNYAYACEVRYTASPAHVAFGNIIDFQQFTPLTDWGPVALVFIIGLGACAFHISIGVGLAGISLYILSAMGWVQINQAVTIPILIVSLVLAFLFAKRGDG